MSGRLVPSNPRRVDQLNEALDLIESRLGARPRPRYRDDETLTTLLDQALKQVSKTPRKEPVRILRHLACSGGTLMSRAITAQPNTSVLSEVDPFNPAHRLSDYRGFAPTDLILLADSLFNPLDDQIKQDMFQASLKVLFEAWTAMGKRLVIREHSHGRFCTRRDWKTARSVTDAITEKFPTCIAVTVRHPLDSMLAMEANGWRQFHPFTLDEYAQRYQAFLDDCGDAPLFRYEDFVKAPDAIMTKLCGALDIPLNPAWKDLLSAVSLSGDSGRSSSRIGLRPRREVSAAFLEETRTSIAYAELCARLGYTPDADKPHDG